MRTLMKVSMPVEPANHAIKNGTLQKTVKTLTDTLHPEASYFYAENGKRTALFVFDMTEASQIPEIVEPLFMSLNAEVTFSPVMNAGDLKTGLEKAAKSMNLTGDRQQVR
jgi:hypothetical protein